MFYFCRGKLFSGFCWKQCW